MLEIRRVQDQKVVAQVIMERVDVKNTLINLLDLEAIRLTLEESTFLLKI